MAPGLSCDYGLWDLPRSGVESIPPALAGILFTSEPPGKTMVTLF